MRKDHPQRSSFNDYLKSVEKQEKAKRWKFFLIMGGFFTFLILLVLSYLPNSSPFMERIPLRELNPQQFQQLLSNNPSGIPVWDEEYGIADTLYHLSDLDRYQLYFEDHAVEWDTVTVTVDPDRFATLDEAISSDESESEEPLATPQLDILGTPKVGSPLQFLIENYEEDNIYLIDHGNGETVKMSNSHRYQYAHSGVYEVKMTVINAERGAQLAYSRSITIRPDKPTKVVMERANKRNRQEPLSSQIAQSPTELENSRGLDSQVSEVLSISQVPLKAEALEARPLGEVVQASEQVAVDEAFSTPPLEVAIISPMDFAEKMPTFPGGIPEMTQFLNRQLKYPELAREYEIQGIVYVQFVIAADGSLGAFKVAKGIGYGCDEEALRIAQNMPNWYPGEHAGKQVPVKFTIPVTFSLQ